jgi:hypothetical protein
MAGEVAPNEMIRSGISEIVGGNGPTVAVKMSLAVICPSLTVMVNATTPVWPVSDVKLRVRFCPEPPKMTAPAGMTSGFDELAAKVKLLGTVSASSIVNESGPTVFPVNVV